MPVLAWLQIVPDVILVPQGEEGAMSLTYHLMPFIQAVEKAWTGKELESHPDLVTDFIIRDRGAFGAQMSSYK